MKRREFFAVAAGSVIAANTEPVSSSAQPITLTREQVRTLMTIANNLGGLTPEQVLEDLRNASLLDPEVTPL